jgi:predicted nucleic acid-binding protein
MTIPFLATTIFLRPLTGDDPHKARACFALIAALEQGRLTAWTSDPVIAELVSVLSWSSAANWSCTVTILTLTASRESPSTSHNTLVPEYS